MILNPDEARGAYYCVAVVVRQKVRDRQPVLPWLQDLYDRLGAEAAMSRPRHGVLCGEGQSDDAVISSREAAVILGMSKRQVHRIAETLGGRIVDRRWLFDKSVVERYAEERRDGRAAGGGRGVPGVPA